ncbi:DUF5017 domain-containing protein [Parasediminibacterium sp. JCM 36343]|uniref:DUF5017 domain-containing protein n=1 Tax=Parasediminibacterium sp. JCM 36343 TaxID=3374279 RepID=UPI003977E8C7
MKNVLILFFFVFLLFACNKVRIKEPSDFQVFADSSVYHANDTVTFSFKGNPDEISMYSGEQNHLYIYANRTMATPDSTLLSFNSVSTLRLASSQADSVNNLSFFISQNFNGTLNATSIKNATWVKLDTVPISKDTANKFSGKIHLEGFANAPFYVAFRYVSDSATATAVARKWAVNGFSLKTYFPDTTVTIASNFSSGGFSSVSILDASNKWVFLNDPIAFNAPAIGSLPNEDWMISRPFKVSTISADLPIKVKFISARLAQFKYIFKKAGTYHVVFVAYNVDANKSAEVVRPIDIIVVN